FKYLYPNETQGKFFEFKNDHGKLNLKLSIVKFGCKKDDRLFIENKNVEIIGNKSIESALENYLLNNKSLQSVENILYADITLNVIDGSSIWLSSMAKILSSVSNTILFLKEDV